LHGLARMKRPFASVARLPDPQHAHCPDKHVRFHNAVLVHLGPKLRAQVGDDGGGSLIVKTGVWVVDSG
jgi:hypothetical protein